MGQKGLWDSFEEGSRAGSTEKAPGLVEIPPDAPLALRMSPRSVDEYVGQEDILGPGKPLRKSLELDLTWSMLFWGPPGTGKTALARLVALKTRSEFCELSAVSAGVSDVRQVISSALETKRKGKRTILFLDEIHRFNKAQQDALLPHVERGTVILIGATTENPYFAVNPALLSRLRVFKFKHLAEEDILTILKRAVADEERGVVRSVPGKVMVEVPDEVLKYIARFSKGDARTALNVLEAACLAGAGEDEKITVTLDSVAEITQSPVVFYDKDQDNHYDIISAFIKSIRGSDPDAAVYWLARMLQGGEDPAYVARRLVIAASEDIGNADPMALVLASAALNAVENIGMPEARIILSQTAIYLALCPKSNSSYLAVEKAYTDVAEKPSYPVPIHLRGTGYSGAAKLGHGDGYLYPHDYPGHWVAQEYLPSELKGVSYFQPADTEKLISQRYSDLKKTQQE